MSNRRDIGSIIPFLRTITRSVRPIRSPLIQFHQRRKLKSGSHFVTLQIVEPQPGRSQLSSATGAHMRENAIASSRRTDDQLLFILDKLRNGRCMGVPAPCLNCAEA
jgi:hypothetical protein